MRTPLAIVALVLAAGCSKKAAPSDAPAIYGGAPDTEHDAVVALTDRGEFFCTATIVKVTGATGYALTAAHCLEGRRSARGLSVVQGDDVKGRQRVVYPVVRFEEHPDYDDRSMTGDLAMIQFSGATASTPVIEAARPGDDDLRRGDEVRFVGYGATERGQGNSRRNEVRGTIARLTDGSFSYGQRRGGPCFGDSGGPALVERGGRLLVVGVTSYGEGSDCRGRGTSMRVSAAYDDFIGPFFEESARPSSPQGDRRPGPPWGPRPGAGPDFDPGRLPCPGLCPGADEPPCPGSCSGSQDNGRRGRRPGSYGSQRREMSAWANLPLRQLFAIPRG